jgi:uncharacterized protein YjiS (DUF1127 family)
MKPGLLEMERQVSVGSPDQQDRPVTNFAINVENLKTSPLTAPPRQGIHRVRNVIFAIFLAGRQILLASHRLVWTIWTYRALVNELDSLTEADFRDLGVRPKDAASVAWKEAWRRAAERYHPHSKEPPS